MSAVEIAPCRYCGVRKRIDTWCSSEQCAERVEKAQAEEREYMRGVLAPEAGQAEPTKTAAELLREAARRDPEAHRAALGRGYGVDRPMGKGCYLTTTELHRLDIAVQPLLALSSHGVMLVGSVGERPDFRDVDVRMILSDEDFDRLFGHSPELWSVFSYAVSRMLAADTGLPVDFQVQRMTEANEKHSGPRNPLGGRARHAMFAGRGDATRFAVTTPEEQQ